MDPNDLFSFLDAAPQPSDLPQDADGDISMQPEANEANGAPPKKRKASALPAATDREEGPSDPKKTRLSSPNPVIVDEVEIEAKREVVASAGLTGAIEAGTRLELRHQVCPLHPPGEINIRTCS